MASEINSLIRHVLLTPCDSTVFIITFSLVCISSYDPQIISTLLLDRRQSVLFIAIPFLASPLQFTRLGNQPHTSSPNTSLFWPALGPATLLGTAAACAGRSFSKYTSDFFLFEDIDAETMRRYYKTHNIRVWFEVASLALRYQIEVTKLQNMRRL